MRYLSVGPSVSCYGCGFSRALADGSTGNVSCCHVKPDLIHVRAPSEDDHAMAIRYFIGCPTTHPRKDARSSDRIPVRGSQWSSEIVLFRDNKG